MNGFFHLGLSIILLFIIGMVIFYGRKEEVFLKKKQLFRRIWYLFLIIAFICYFMVNGLDLKLWRDMLIIVSMFIFVDIAIFLTPSISKIWGAELILDEVVKTSKELEEKVTSTNAKIDLFSDILGRINTDDLKSISWKTEDDYIDDLQSFLQVYSNQCFQEVYVINYQNKVEVVQSTRILGFHLENAHLESLEETGIIQIDDQIAIMLIKIVYPVIIIAKAQQKSIQDVDFVNLINMATIHSWHKAC
ncbi:type II toxin-antitoxin system SpoIISA family toxin [Fictibacillus gelatini]|uniref:type II toxin-antitoxin system SpoIISA family toxin n=1 Tax=Fictibacillus gelatini TaxID=225985 RepID=UPI00041AEA1C|nr:type II toxin-antitoxin system SpoIISA family toxin [Fictibacillus gelatini]